MKRYQFINLKLYRQIENKREPNCPVIGLFSIHRLIDRYIEWTLPQMKNVVKACLTSVRKNLDIGTRIEIYRQKYRYISE